MATRDIVVVGASLGGVEALRILLRGLPADFPASVFIVLHRMPDRPSYLEQVLGGCALKVFSARDGEQVRRSAVYIAPPDRHLMLERGKIRVDFGPKENLHRPSVDVLFRSAAQSYGPQVTGVVLTGSQSDGAAGLAAIKAHGGLAIVQSPDDATDPSMPLSALRQSEVDFCLPLVEIADELKKIVVEKVKAVSPEKVHVPSMMNGVPLAFICPECGGSLRELKDGKATRFQCHVGHSYTLQSLLDGQNEELENALWVAVRSLRERATMQRRLAVEMKNKDFEKKAAINDRHAEAIEHMMSSSIH